MRAIGNEPSNADLVCAAQAGSASAFEKLVMRHCGLVYSIALSYLRSPEPAEDLSQEVFLHVFLRIKDLREPAAFTVWLSRAARNRARDWQRNGQRASRLAQMVSLEAAPELHPRLQRSQEARDAAEDAEERAMLSDAIFRLPEEQRELVLLHYMENLDRKQIAERLGAHPSTIGRQLQKAVGALKASLEPALRKQVSASFAPSPRLALRTAGLVGAAAAMSLSSRTAMAASADSLSSIMPAASIGQLTGIAGFFKSILAVTITGGKIMGFGKIAVTAVVAASVAGGSYYCVERRATGQPIVWRVKATVEYPFRRELPKPKYVDSLLRLKRQEGRDNAMIHYSLAAWATPNTGLLTDRNAVLQAALEQGWGPEAEQFRPFIVSMQPAFAEVRKGAALDYAKGVGFGDGTDTEAQNFLVAQITSKMMLLEGRLFEKEGKPDAALDNYLTVLTMGRDYCSADNTLIAFLVGIACESLSLKQACRLIASGQLDKPALQSALERLKRVERTHQTIDGALAAEKAVFESLRAKEPNMQPPDFLEATTRYKTLLSKLMQTQLAAALVFSKAENGAYPGSLEALVPARLAQMPLDPFSGASFSYGAQGNGFCLYGIGPDGLNQSGAVIYDASNGTQSVGDIVP